MLIKWKRILPGSISSAATALRNPGTANWKLGFSIALNCTAFWLNGASCKNQAKFNRAQSACRWKHWSWIWNKTFWFVRKFSSWHKRLLCYCHQAMCYHLMEPNRKSCEYEQQIWLLSLGYKSQLQSINCPFSSESFFPLNAVSRKSRDRKIQRNSW